MNNKKLTKGQILENVTMDVDTYLKNKGAFDPKKDNIKVVPKGSLEKSSTSIMDENDDHENVGRGVDYGYDPELDGDSWEEFLKSIAELPHQKNVNSDGVVSEVKIRRKDFNLLNENKKWL